MGLPRVVASLACGAVALVALGAERTEVERLAALTLDEEQWARATGSKGLYLLRETPSSTVKEGIAVAVIEAPPERVFKVVTDNAHFAEFLPRVRESTVEDKNADGTRYVNYQHLAIPVISDREYKVEILNEVRLDGERRIWESSWTHVKGFGNIDDSHGSWSLMESGAGGTLLVYRVVTDPGGGVPRFLKNFATRRALPGLIEGVRDRVVDPRYD